MIEGFYACMRAKLMRYELHGGEKKMHFHSRSRRGENLSDAFLCVNL